MIVLRIAHPDDLVRGEPDLAQGRLKTAALVHAGRQHHDRVAVEDDLKLQAQVADRLEDRDLVWPSGRHDRLAPDDRFNPASRQLAHQLR